MEKIKYRDIAVNDVWKLWGGGSTFGQEFIGVVKEKIGKVGDQEERKAHEAGQAHPELRFSHNYLRVIGGLIILLK